MRDVRKRMKERNDNDGEDADNDDDNEDIKKHQDLMMRSSEEMVGNTGGVCVCVHCIK